jgi:hypothetical protein
MFKDVSRELLKATVGAPGSELPSRRYGMERESTAVTYEITAALEPGMVVFFASAEVKPAVEGSLDREDNSRGAGPKT